MATDTTPAGPAAVRVAVEEAVAAFEAARAVGPADPAAYCPPPGSPAHLPTAVELIRADLEFAWEGGRPAGVNDYRAAFPAVFADPAGLDAVRFEENRLLLAHGRAADRPATERVRASQLGPVPPDGAAPPADRFPEPGESYLGFRLVRELGRGAFARVYLAEQPELAGRWVALKVSAQLAGESQTLARLQHPNVVPVYSVHRAGRFQAVCMPFFGTATLADVLHGLRAHPALPASGSGFVSTVKQQKDPTVGPAPAATPPGDPVARPAIENPLVRLAGMTHTAAALWVAAELAEGLDHAHARGVLHRDIKPANVLLADDGRPMLLDFNLAAAGGPPDGVGGTPFYMAPEQLAALAGQPVAVDARSDVYSLGLVLYELLTGRPPADPPAGSAVERLAALRLARVAPPPTARGLNPAVTPATDAILARCLHPAPARRYPSARHLAEDLRSQLADRPLPHAGEPSARERAGMWLRRHPWARSQPFAAAVVTVVGGLGLGGYLLRTRQYEAAAAANAFATLRADADAARPLLLAPNPSARDLDAGTTAGRELLGRYGLPGGDWDQSPLVRRLSAADRAALGRELGTVAALTAGREERRGNLPGAAEFSAIAAGLLPDDPFVRRQAERVQAAEAVELAVAELTAARRIGTCWGRYGRPRGRPGRSRGTGGSGGRYTPNSASGRRPSGATPPPRPSARRTPPPCGCSAAGLTSR